MELLILFVALLLVVFVYMTGWFVIARLTHRYDVVDSAWGLGFVLVGWVSLAVRSNFAVLPVVSAILVSLWGLRLFGHIASRNWRKSEDDHRYIALRDKWGDRHPQKFYTNVFLLQGLLLTAISLPMIGVAASTHTASFLTYIGFVIWLLGIVFEAVADRQLAVFVARRPKGSHQIMDKGLWHYSRHPNYFGEITVWWGASLVAISVGSWWGIIGAALITVLITKVSGIPLLEKHYDGNKAYEAYRARTSILIPLPPRQK